MAPTIMGTSTIFLDEAARAAEIVKSVYTQADVRKQQTQIPPVTSKEPQQYKREIVWRNVVFFVYLHCAALYGFYLIFTEIRFYTFLFGK